MADVTLKRVDEIEAYAGPRAIPGIRMRPAARALGITAWGMNVIDLDAGTTRYPEHDHVTSGQEEVLRAPLRQRDLARGRRGVAARASDARARRPGREAQDRTRPRWREGACAGRHAGQGVRAAAVRGRGPP